MSLLTIVLTRKKIDSLVEASKPKHSIYKNLKKALLTLNTMPEENFDTIKYKEKIYFGVKSPAIEKIKQRLRYWGDIKPNDTIANNQYNESFKKGVMRFQSRHGLVADGKIGAGTLKIINISKETRRQQIITNLERWRWFPENLGDNFLGVNLPDYQLQVVENRDTVANI